MVGIRCRSTVDWYRVIVVHRDEVSGFGCSAFGNVAVCCACRGASCEKPGQLHAHRPDGERGGGLSLGLPGDHREAAWSGLGECSPAIRGFLSQGSGCRESRHATAGAARRERRSGAGAAANGRGHAARPGHDRDGAAPGAPCPSEADTCRGSSRGQETSGRCTTPAQCAIAICCAVSAAVRLGHHARPERPQIERRGNSARSCAV